MTSDASSVLLVHLNVTDALKSMEYSPACVGVLVRCSWLSAAIIFMPGGTCVSSQLHSTTTGHSPLLSGNLVEDSQADAIQPRVSTPTVASPAPLPVSPADVGHRSSGRSMTE